MSANGFQTPKPLAPRQQIVRGIPTRRGSPPTPAKASVSPAVPACYDGRRAVMHTIGAPNTSDCDRLSAPGWRISSSFAAPATRAWFSSGQRRFQYKIEIQDHAGGRRSPLAGLTTNLNPVVMIMHLPLWPGSFPGP